MLFLSDETTSPLVPNMKKSWQWCACLKINKTIIHLYIFSTHPSSTNRKKRLSIVENSIFHLSSSGEPIAGKVEHRESPYLHWCFRGSVETTPNTDTLAYMSPHQLRPKKGEPTSKDNEGLPQPLEFSSSASPLIQSLSINNELRHCSTSMPLWF